MSNSTSISTARKAHILDLVAEALALYLRAQGTAPRQDGRHHYFCQYTSPLGHAKHLELVKLGILPGTKKGKRVLIREDVIRCWLAGYYSQRDSPLGRERHLELAEGGMLPSMRVERSVFIRRDVVHQYLSSRGEQS